MAEELGAIAGEISIAAGETGQHILPSNDGLIVQKLKELIAQGGGGGGTVDLEKLVVIYSQIGYPAQTLEYDGKAQVVIPIEDFFSSTTGDFGSTIGEVPDITSDEMDESEIAVSGSVLNLLSVNAVGVTGTSSVYPGVTPRLLYKKTDTTAEQYAVVFSVEDSNFKYEYYMNRPADGVWHARLTRKNSELTSITFKQVTGVGIMTNSLAYLYDIKANTPSSDTGIANKKYVDDAIDAAFGTIVNGSY